MSNTKADTKLMEALDFNRDDLRENENDKISESQLTKIKAQVRYHLRNAILTAVISLFAFGLAIGAADALSVLIGVVGVGYVGWSLWQWRKARADLTDEPDWIEGELRITQTNRSRLNPKFKLSIDEESFDVGIAISEGFTAGDTYRLYFAPQSKVLLSAVWVGKGKVAEDKADETAAEPVEDETV